MAGFRSMGVDPIPVVRQSRLRGPVDILVNAACPSRRLDAQQRPLWDFQESAGKSMEIYYGHDFGRFLQVSSLSARYPENSLYGRNRLLAEQAVASDRTVVCRVGPMYGRGLTKGVLVDMLAGRPVYADPRTRYGFADVRWVGQRIAKIALGTRTGVLEVGGRGWLELAHVAESIGSPSEFKSSEYLAVREDQYLPEPEYIGEDVQARLAYADPLDEDVPDSRLVLDWLRAQNEPERQ